MSLRRATAHLARRRLVRSLGYRGAHPRRVFAVGVAVAVLADALLTLMVVAWVKAQPATPDLTHAVVPAVALLVAYAFAGPGVLLAEGARAPDSSHAGVLRSLPVRRAQARMSLELPSLTVVDAWVALMVPPTVAALVAAQVPFGAALLAVTATTAVAAATSAVSLMVAATVVTGWRWSPLRHTVALLGFMLALVLVIVSVLRRAVGLSPLDRVLGVPVILREVQQLGSVTAGTGLLAVLAALVWLTLGLAGSTRADPTEGDDAPLIRWNRSDRPRLVVADLLYALRNPTLVSNLVASAAVSTTLVVVLLRMSPGTARMVVTPVLIVVPLLGGQSVRMVRGMFSATNPPPQLAGVTMASWVYRIDLVAVALFAVVTLPVAAIAVRPDLLVALDRGEYVRAVLACLGVSLLLTWAVPGHASNPAAQVVAVLLYLAVASLVLWGVHGVAVLSPAAAHVVAGGVLATAIACGPRLERARWQPTGRQRDTSIAATERLSAR
jgi:hypothetical protein